MNIAIILAGGTGKRMNKSGMPKQFLKLGNKEILLHTIEKFEFNSKINKILLVINKVWLNYTKELVNKKNYSKIISLIPGGDTRQESSYNALLYLNNIISNNDIVIIHDAVRPFINDDIINNTIEKSKKYGACCVVVKTIDSMVRAENNLITDIIERSNLYNEQTPQGFKFSVIWEAYKKANINNIKNFTDDISFVYNIGKPVYLLEGDYKNIKITTELDLQIAKEIFNNSQY